MSIRYRVTSFTSSGGEIVRLPTAGVTALVGGNNAGKSQILREIFARANESEASLKNAALSAMEVERPSATVAETAVWLDQTAIRQDRGPNREAKYTSEIHGVGQSAEEIQRWFESTRQGASYLGNAAEHFVRWTTAGDLSGYAAGTVGVQSGRDANSPLARLFSDGALEETLSNLAKKIFGEELVLDRVNPEIRLRVGKVVAPVPPLNRPTAAYAEEVSRLPTLDMQGDGFRSFVGLALLMLAESPNLLLIDEPEAFLHPGQARSLGRWIAQHAVKEDIQIVLATHDRDLVLGLLEGASGEESVSFVRLNRVANTTHVSQLEPEQVEAVWSQPVLRYSNALQGLFHRSVVMCEGDSDCRFYGAALDELALSTDRRATADDILFVPSGGKRGIPGMARALTSLNVEARAIVDFDVLRDKKDVERIVVALGGSWTAEVEELYRRSIVAPNAGRLWDQLKHAGIQGMPAGDSYSAVIDLIQALRDLRLYIVPVGEMEGFYKVQALHGPEWVAGALTAKAHLSERVREFIGPLLT